MYHSPLQMLNSYLIKGERPSLPSRLFYEPRSQYIVNQSGSAKETVSPKIGKNIEMLVRFIYMGTQDRTLIDINHYQVTMNQHKNWTKKLNKNIYKVKFLLYQLLIFLNVFIIYLFRQRDCKKKRFLLTGGSWLFFISPGQWIGNEQLLKVGPIKDLNLALNHGPSFHFNIKMTENMKFLTPL